MPQLSSYCRLLTRTTIQHPIDRDVEFIGSGHVDQVGLTKLPLWVLILQPQVALVEAQHVSNACCT